MLLIVLQYVDRRMLVQRLVKLKRWRGTMLPLLRICQLLCRKRTVLMLLSVLENLTSGRNWNVSNNNNTNNNTTIYKVP